MSSAPNQPVATRRDGQLELAIWENSGQYGPMFSMTIKRSYRDSEGNWKESSGFLAADALRVSELARWAHAWITSRKEELRTSDVGHDDDQQDQQEQRPAARSASGPAEPTDMVSLKLPNGDTVLITRDQWNKIKAAKEAKKQPRTRPATPAEVEALLANIL